MFKNSNIFLLSDTSSKSKEYELSKLSVDNDTREQINNSFNDFVNTQIDFCDEKLKKPIPYNEKTSDYIPRSEEAYLYIDNFELPEYLNEGVCNNLSLKTFSLGKESGLNIKAVFLADVKDGKIHYAAFQRFRSHQYLSPHGFHFFFSPKTYKLQNNLHSEKGRAGITIAPIVDCVYDDGVLKFKSDYYVNQIFDLNKYMKAASRDEVVAFYNHPNFYVENIDSIMKTLGIRECKKITNIASNRILEEHPVDEIKSIADQMNIQLEISDDNKIVIPAKTSERTDLIAFLDEDIYRGCFSEEIYFSNSKRPKNGS